MGATVQDPMRSVRITKEKNIIRANPDLSDEEKIDAINLLNKFVGANKIAMFTSGYYSINYIYKLYCAYSNRMHGRFESQFSGNDILGEDDMQDPRDYTTFQIPHWVIPEGFLDRKALIQAEIDMSPIQFRMEYEAAWILDTGGFFKITDLDACRSARLGLEDHKIQSRGSSGKTYIITIDPARISDAFAIIVSEYDPTFGMKIVWIEEYFGNDAHTTKMVKRIFELSNQFNTIRIGIDKGGGGQQVADYLAQGTLIDEPIYDIDDEAYRGLRGRHILYVVDFSSNWIEGAHHNAYTLLQRRQISFPSKAIGKIDKEDEAERRDIAHNIVEKLITQLIGIQQSETRTGRMHFDLPKGGYQEKHKDLYSAFLIGADMVYNMIQRESLPTRAMPSMGIIIPRESRYSRRF